MNVSQGPADGRRASDLDHRPMMPGIAHGQRPAIDFTGAGIAQRRQMIGQVPTHPVSIRVRACHLLEIPGCSPISGGRNPTAVVGSVSR